MHPLLPPLPGLPLSACRFAHPSFPACLPAHLPALQLQKEWGEGDTMLLDLLPFLEAVVRTQVGGWVAGWVLEETWGSIRPCLCVCVSK